MKRGATKEEIIRTTKGLIVRNGIRAVRVDEIVGLLGISKRTLYEMFTDKDGLMCECLAEMARSERERIANYRKGRSTNPLQKLFVLIDEYIDKLFVVESSFLADIRSKSVYADQFRAQRKFWCDEFSYHLEACRKEELLQSGIGSTVFAAQILDSLFRMRIDHAAQGELTYFGRAVLRGSTTRKGIELIDRMV